MILTQNLQLPLTTRGSANISMSTDIPSVDTDLSLTLPSSELFGLCHKIKSLSLQKALKIVQFASAYEGEGANLIAFEVATLAATQLGLKVMYIDTGTQISGPRKKLSSKLSIPLSVLLHMGGEMSNALVGASGTKLTYTALRWHDNGTLQLSNLEDFANFLQFMRPYYDLIVLSSPAVVADSLAAAISRLADGSIIVVEAGRTRAPVVIQAKQLLLAHGGHVIGAVFNKRRFYIPHWLYSWL